MKQANKVVIAYIASLWESLHSPLAIQIGLMLLHGTFRGAFGSTCMLEQHNSVFDAAEQGSSVGTVAKQGISVLTAAGLGKSVIAMSEHDLPVVMWT